MRPTHRGLASAAALLSEAVRMSGGGMDRARLLGEAANVDARKPAKPKPTADARKRKAKRKAAKLARKRNR